MSPETEDAVEKSIAKGRNIILGARAEACLG